MSRSAGGRRMRAAAQCTSGDRPPPRRGQRSDLVLVGVHARPGIATGQPGKALPALGCNQALPMTALWGSPLPAPSSFGLSFYTLCCIVQSIPIAALSLFLSGALVLYALAHPSCSKSVLYAVLLRVYLHLLNSVPILGCILQKMEFNLFTFDCSCTELCFYRILSRMRPHLFVHRPLSSRPRAR